MPQQELKTNEPSQQRAENKEVKLSTTPVFDRNFIALTQREESIILNEGGTRSSKTYSIAQIMALLQIYAIKNEDAGAFLDANFPDGLKVTITRKTLPALKASAMEDFFEIHRNLGYYSDKYRNKTEHTYEMGGVTVQFLSVDQEEKVRGQKRDILWLNEANEFTYDDFRQLNFRTKWKVIADFNPVDEYHWLAEKVMARPDTYLIKSNYKDNPYLPDRQIHEIERLKETDENYWRMYGLGLRGIQKTKIYNNWRYVDELPEEYDDRVYAFDWGWNNPKALVEIRFKDGDIYLKEHIYASRLKLQSRDDNEEDVIDIMNEKEISKDDYIFCDPSEPENIKVLKDAGYNAKKANNSVEAGIETVKGYGIRITKDSINLAKEIRNYRFKEKDGEPLDTPVKQDDHGMDCVRYGVHSYQDKPSKTVVKGGRINKLRRS